MRNDKRRTLDRFATLLGAYRLKEQRDGAKQGCLSTLFSTESDFSCSVPCLSLRSMMHNDGRQTGTEHCHGDEDKHKIEELASTNLARPLFSTTKTLPRTPVAPTTNSTGNAFSEENMTISEIPCLMLENLAKSFLTLTNARLKAYLNILARHGVTLASCSPIRDEGKQKEGIFAVERKIQALINVGTGITIENMVTSFHLDDKSMDGGHDVDSNVDAIPLVMETTMDVSIPKTCGGKEIVTVGASTKGTISASFKSDNQILSTAEILIDCHELLSQLIERASLVMSKALDIVRVVCSQAPYFPHGPLPQHDPSAPEMLPPKLVVPFVSGQLALISPDVEPKQKEPPVSSFQLDDTIANLSPERCANIVDFVIGEVDHISFPPRKRLKIGD